MDWKRINSLNSFVCVYETGVRKLGDSVCVCERERERNYGVRRLGDSVCV